MKRVAAAAIAGFALLALAAVLVLRSSWFASQVRRRVVSELERVTGGRVELKTFAFGWRPLTVEIHGLVLHGLEPPAEEPLLAVDSLRAGLSLVSLVKTEVRLAALDVAGPRVHVIVSPDGRTNIPPPKQPRGQPAEELVRLSIGRFSVQQGVLEVAGRTLPLESRGENLQLQLGYDPGHARYIGAASAQLRGLAPLPVALRISGLALDAGKVEVATAEATHGRSRARIENFSYAFASRGAGRFEATVALDELGGVFKSAGGSASLHGSVTFGGLDDYRIEGAGEVAGVTLRHGNLKAAGIRATSAFEATPVKISFHGLRIDALGGTLEGAGEIVGRRSYMLRGEADGFQLRQLTGNAWSGVVSGAVEAGGLLGEPPRRAAARLTIIPAPGGIPASGRIDASYDGRGKTLSLGESVFSAGATRLAFSGILGSRLNVRLESANLDDLRPVIDQFPVRLDQGAALVDGTVSGDLESPEFKGHVALTNFEFSGRRFARLSADVAANAASITARNADLLWNGARARGEGSMTLDHWKPLETSVISGRAAATGMPIADFVPAIRGPLSAEVRFAGTLADPHLSADAELRGATLFDEAVDRVQAHVEYTKALVEASGVRIATGSSLLSGSGSLTEAGGLRFRLSTNSIALEHFASLRKLHPGITGAMEIKAEGAGVWRGPNTPLSLTELNAEASAARLQVDRRPLGAGTLTARSVREGGHTDLVVSLESDAFGADLRGSGRWRLEGEYPGSIELHASPLAFPKLQEWLAPAANLKLDGSAEGSLRASGPGIEWDRWTGAVEIPKFELRPPASGAFRLNNAQPIRAFLSKSVWRVEGALLEGPSTSLTVSGSIAPLEKSPLDLSVKGSVNLVLLGMFSQDVLASGNGTVGATIKGTFGDPRAAGSFELKDASLRAPDVPNGLSNVAGAILFDGARATIPSLTGETGGGKVTLSGFVSFAGGDVAYRLQASGAQIRVRYPEGVSNTVSAAFNLTGGRQRSLLAGTVTILRTGFNPRTDFATLLAKSAEPSRTPAARTGPLAGMQLDVRIETSPDISFESALAQDLQVDANLRLRGTPYTPALLGRITVSQGELNFFGTKYTINQGSITFANPLRVEPVLDVNVETRVRGIDVALTLSGPIHKLNVTHRSDPPLEFGEVVALLATGRTPTVDPALAASQARQPQSFSQVGADALLGQAISGPVSSRLERFFGVSKLKIDPSLTGVENNPQARLTVEQQLARNVTFTYITNLTRSNPQVVRVEWNLNREWSAVAVREENGLFGLDFLYKKRF